MAASSFSLDRDFVTTATVKNVSSGLSSKFIGIYTFSPLRDVVPMVRLSRKWEVELLIRSHARWAVQDCKGPILPRCDVQISFEDRAAKM